MAIKTIETRAVISAEDKTGQTFSAIAQKVKGMESVAKRASETAGRVGVSVGSSFGGITTRAYAATRAINATSVAIAGLAVVGVEKLAKLAESVVDVGVEFDKLARRQQAVFNISAEQQKPLLAQAAALGATTPFKQPEVLAAQTELGKRGLSLAEATPITAAAAAYAQAQGVGLPEATKLLATAIFAEGKRGADTKEIGRIADRLVKASQISGMTAEEMEAAQKGGATEAAGVSQPFLMAQIGAMRLAGNKEPGQSARLFASRLSKPTPDALSTLAALGIRFGDYAKAGKAMRAEDLSSEFETGARGQKLSALGLKSVQAVLSNPAIAGDEGKLTKALTEILQEAPKKAGGKSPDAAAISKIIKKFWEESIESVDIEGLERALMKKHISGTQAADIFGTKAGLTWLPFSEHAADVSKFEKAIKETPEGLAAREAGKQMGGLAGAKIRAEGGWQNVLTTLAKDSEKWMTPLYNAASRLEAGFIGASDSFRDLGEKVGGAIAGVAGLAAALKIFSFFGLAPAGAASAAGPLGLAGAGAYGFFSHVPMAEGGDSYGLSHPGWHPGMPKESTRFGGGRNHWLSSQPPDASRFTPGGLGNFTELRGAADVSVKVGVDLSPDLIATRIDKALAARGNMRVPDTGVSMPPSLR
jgi:hypothetical protein